jgi:hypothetical protein
MEKIFAQFYDAFVHLLPPLAGGVVDYLNQLQKGGKRWSLKGFAVHLLSAVFFGWMVGAAAGGLGYEVSTVAAAGGMGGFLGVRFADLITYKFMNIDRRDKY